MRISFMQKACLGLAMAAGVALLPSLSIAKTYNLTVDKVTIDTGDFQKEGIGYNGKSPGPVLRFQEGEDVTINVTNNLDESTSIHWHGLILPFQMDGVPKISYPGIAPGETFTYKFPIIQSGTYWFHSHSGFQEPDGAYGSIVIEPEKRDPFRQGLCCSVYGHPSPFRQANISELENVGGLLQSPATNSQGFLFRCQQERF